MLWLGDPSALPLGSWELTDGLAYGTTDGGSPALQDLVVGSDEGSTGLLADVVDLARTGQTARLGRLLAPMGIRYVVVAQRLAPAPFATESRPTPRGFVATLDAQLDLEPLDVPAGLLVYRNQAAFPMLAALPADPPPPIDGAVSDAAHTDLSSAEAVLTDEVGHLSWKGEVPSNSEVLIAEAHSDRWQLRVGGRTLARHQDVRLRHRLQRGRGRQARRSGTAPPRSATASSSSRRSRGSGRLRALVRIRLAPACRPPPRASPRSAGSATMTAMTTMATMAMAMTTTRTAHDAQP